LREGVEVGDLGAHGVGVLSADPLGDVGLAEVFFATGLGVEQQECLEALFEGIGVFVVAGDRRVCRECAFQKCFEDFCLIFVG